MSWHRFLEALRRLTCRWRGHQWIVGLRRGDITCIRCGETVRGVDGVRDPLA